MKFDSKIIYFINVFNILESLGVIFWLLSIPADPSNDFFLGHSLRRWILIVIPSIWCLLNLYFILLGRHKKNEILFNLTRNIHLFLLILFTLVISFIGLYIRSYTEDGMLIGLLDRITPILFLFIFGAIKLLFLQILMSNASIIRDALNNLKSYNDVQHSRFQLSRRHEYILITMTILVTLLVIYVVYSEIFIFGSEAGNWVYSYFMDVKPIPIFIPVIVFVLLGSLIYVSTYTIKSYETLTLMIGFLVLLMIQILIRSIYPIPMSMIVVSEDANSFYTPAEQYSPIEILSQYPLLAPTFPSHARSNLPGKILFFQLIGIFTKNPSFLAYLIMTFSALGGILLYIICKKLFVDKKIALYSFVFYSIIPGKLFFFPILNTVTPVFILACLYLLLAYLESRKSILLIVLGISFYLLILFEPSPLATGIIFAGLLLNSIGQNTIGIKQISQVFILPAMSFLGFYMLMASVFSFDLLNGFGYILQDAVLFNSKAGRGYWIWFYENTKEFIFGAGVPIIFLSAYHLFYSIRQMIISKKPVYKWPVEDTFVMSVFCTFLAVLFLGINRGEVTRLWIYLAVFFQIPAAFIMARVIRSDLSFLMVVSLLVIQSMIGLQKVSFIIP